LKRCAREDARTYAYKEARLTCEDLLTGGAYAFD